MLSVIAYACMVKVFIFVHVHFLQVKTEHRFLPPQVDPHDISKIDSQMRLRTSDMRQISS